MAEYSLLLQWNQAVHHLNNECSHRHNVLGRTLTEREIAFRQKEAEKLEEDIKILNEMKHLSLRAATINLIPRNKEAFDFLKSEEERLTAIVEPTEAEQDELLEKRLILGETMELLKGFEGSPFEAEEEEK